MRIYSEDTIRKRKLMSGDEKPTRKYTKAIKEEIKKEPFELSDNDDIDGDDVMDIEEADGTLPKKGKLGVMGAKKRIMKTKKIKKVLKPADQKDQKDKPKPKRKKKPQLVQPAGNENIMLMPSTPTITQAVNSKSNANQPTSEPSKSAKKNITKPKEKKIKQKVMKVTQKGVKDDTKAHQQSQHNNSDSDSSPEESDAYETCGVLNCTRPSGETFFSFSLILLSNFFYYFHLLRISSRLDFV